MHELAVTESILKVATEAAERAGGGTVTGIHLVIGDLASVIDDCVQFYWDIVSKDTPAQGATLHFRRVPMKFECQECHREFGHEGESYLCPACGSLKVKVVAGDEFRLEAIDLEETV